jgi:hypothetical protein
MKRTIFLIAAGLATVFLWAQQQRDATARSGFEVKSLFPHETSPGRYAQVEPNELQDASLQGWELVSAVPFVYRNEEHNNGDMHGPKPVVTQVYPAYIFKRARRN